MFTLSQLTIASIKMFVRNRPAMFFTFFTPLLIIVIFGAIGFNSTPTINVGVAVQGSISNSSQQFIQGLKKISAFKLTYGSDAAESKALESGNRAAVIVLSNNPFDRNVSSNISNNSAKTLTILTNAGDPQSQTVVSIIDQVLDKSTLAAANVKPLVSLDIKEVNSHNLKYMDFLLPGLVALSIMQLSVFSVAFVFVEYKEKGILKRILATPVKPYQFVTANIITRLLVAIVQAAFFIAIGVLVFKVHIIGSYLLILLIVILGAIMFLGLGFTISGLSTTTESVPALANLVVFPMLFLGGTFFSVDAMPTWLQYIAKVLPLTYFSGALRDVMNKGSNISDIGYELTWMLGWSIVLVTLAVFTFSFEEKKI